MTKKKIAFVVAIPGSAEAFLTNHFEVLTQEYDVTLIANFPKDYNASCFKEMKINFINAPIRREISVKKDTPYRITCMVKTENIQMLLHQKLCSLI